MKEVGILASSYKSENYLKNYLKNVNNQSFKNFDLYFEHIIPSKKEKKILKKSNFPVEKIKYSLHEDLISLPKAWNNIIERSDCKYLCIWNIDDIRTKDSIEIMYKYLEENKDKSFAYGNYTIVKKYKSKKGKYINEEGREKELKSSMILGPFFMFKKDVIKKIGKFDEQLISGADYDFAMRLGNNFKGGHINTNLGFYLNSGDGLSTKKESKQEIERTVVELRYNIKVLDQNLVMKAQDQYDIENMFVNDKKVKVLN